MTRRLAAALSLVAASTLGLAPVADAHIGGKAEPRIAAGLSGQGFARNLVVRLTDVDSGNPIGGATVSASASMTQPHPMQLVPSPLRQTGLGTYTGRLLLPMPAVWTIKIDVKGDDVVSASSSLRTRTQVVGKPVSTPAPPIESLPTLIDDSLTSGDFLRMAVLWSHGLAATGWILGVLVMAVALASEPSLLAEGARARISRWYRRVGVWLHWALVPVIVATGVYNMLYVTPFALAWTPDEIRQLGEIPYGPLYEAILVLKLSLFVALLLTATQVLVRTTRSDRTGTASRGTGAMTTLWSALGAPGLVFVLSVPLILGAAMALRYVHVLNHVATVLNDGS